MEKKKIPQATYDLLMKMIELAEKREPIQGEFCFRVFNYSFAGLRKKEGVLHCGTFGCIAGGYLPLIERKRFYFDDGGTFMDGEDMFLSGQMYKELGNSVFTALFNDGHQCNLGLPDLPDDASKEAVIANAKVILENFLEPETV